MARTIGGIASGLRVRHLIAATSSLAALAVADPAWAQCATATAGGVTTLTCGNTVTTDSTNTDGNNASTSANFQRFATGINATINAGTTISGFGLLLNSSGAQAINVTNNGTISNTSGTAAQTIAGGLRVVGNSGLITYLGSGNVTTAFNGAPTPGAAPVAGLSLENIGAGGIALGSGAAPVTGLFRGPDAISLSSFGSGNINAWINGGTLDAAGYSSLSIAGQGNMNLAMTGSTIMTGPLLIGNYGGAPGAFGINVSTDARIGTTAAPVTNAVNIGIGGTTGGLTSVALTGTGAIFGRSNAILIQRNSTAPGAIQLTTGAGTTISAVGAPAFGINVQGQGAGAISLDLGGSVTSLLGGVLVTTGDGAVGVTIRQGATVSGNVNALEVRRAFGASGASETLVLGTLTSPNTAATFDGILRIGNGGTSGTISGNVINDGSLIINRSDAITYAGVISGTGILAKQGAGSLTLTGISTFTGGTTISAGTLNVNGSLTGAVTVANGATLGGTGSVGSTTVNGTLSPGNDGTIGTLTINGNLVFNAGSIFRVDIGNGVNDRVNVTGTAALAGGVAAFASSTVFTAGTYTLLNAVGGISGTFNPLTTTPNAPARLRYDGNNVFLEVDAAANQTFAMSTRESLVFNAPTVTTSRVNAFSTQIVGRLLGGQPLYDQTFAAAFNSVAVQNGLTAARAAITTAGGPGVIIGDAVRTSSTTTSATTSATTYALAGPGAVTQSTVVTFGPATIQVGALSTCNVSSLPSATRPSCTNGGTSFTVADGTENFNMITTTTYTINETRTDTTTDTLRETYELTGQVAAVGRIHAEVQSGVLDLGGRLLGRLAAIGAGNEGWAEVYGFRVRQGGRRDARGLAGGFGVAVAPGVTLGAGIDHGRLDIDVPGANEDGEVELTEIGLVARVESGPFTASLAAVHGFGEAETLRTIIGSSRADYDVRLTGAALEFGYAIDTGGWTLRPVAGLDYLRLSTDAFAETDTLGLIAAEQDFDRVRASAGIEVGRDFGGIAIGGSVRYLAVLDGDERGLPVAFAAAPGRLLDMSGPNEPDTLMVGARAGISLAPNTALTFSYGGRFGGGYEAHAIAAGFRASF